MISELRDGAAAFFRHPGIQPFFWSLVFVSWFLAPALQALALGAPAGGAASTPAPDVIVFTNGDQLTGKLLREAGGTVTFHSDVIGDISVTWDKIKSIRSSQQFAVIKKGVAVSHKTPVSQIPEGVVVVQSQQIQLTPPNGGAEQTIPTTNAQYMIDEPTYLKEVRGHPGFTHGWTGSVTAGASQVEATQNSRTFTAAATGVRTVPNVAWLSSQSRTIFNFTSAYGSVSSPSAPTVKTNIIHGDAEQDWYIHPRLYLLAVASFDHNYSQGLDLQQIYGGGLGAVVVKDAKQELDLKTDLHYERQSFGNTPGIVPPVITPAKSLIGADVGDTYVLKLPHKMLFNQSLVAAPAFNDVNAYSGTLTAGLAFPVYKRFSFTLGLLDDFLNDPALGSKKNSFQYTAGLTYSF